MEAEYKRKMPLGLDEGNLLDNETRQDPVVTSIKAEPLVDKELHRKSDFDLNLAITRCEELLSSTLNEYLPGKGAKLMANIKRYKEELERRSFLLLEKSTVCLQCGDEGADNALVFCVKCLGCAVHRYCLDVLPKTLDEIVPWLCDDCQPRVTTQYVRKETPRLADLNKRKRRKLYATHFIANRRKRRPALHSRLSGDSTLKKNLIKGKEGNGTCLVGKTRGMDPSEASKAGDDKRLTTLEHEKSYSGCSAVKIKSDSKLIESTCLVDKMKGRIYSEHETKDDNFFVGDCSPNNEETKTIPICCENMIEDTKFENSGIQMTNYQKGSNYKVSPSIDVQISLQDDSDEPGRPFEETVWRGSFNISNKGTENFFEGFVAHLSTKACPKVSEEATLLPSLLDLEMLTKSALWPKSFQETPPTDDHIALYFFPADLGSERVFDCLVEDMISGELAMRALGKNAELLIFASKVLPMSFWRFREKYYLWGVFKGKRSESSSADLSLAALQESATCVDTINEDDHKRINQSQPQSPQSALSNTSDHLMDMVSSG